MMSADELAAAHRARGGRAAVARPGGLASGAADDAPRARVGGARDVLFDLASVTKPMTARRDRAGRASTSARRSATSSRRRAERRASACRSSSSSRTARGSTAHRTLYAPLLRGEPVDVAARPCAKPPTRGGRTRRGDPPAGGIRAPLQRSRLRPRGRGARAGRRRARRGRGHRAPRARAARAGARRAGTVRDLAGARRSWPVRADRDGRLARRARSSGAVHDENAWALTGTGGSGHAGIFGTVDAVLSLRARRARRAAGARARMARARAPGRDAARRIRRQEPRTVAVQRGHAHGAAGFRSPRLHRDEPVDRSGRARRRRPPHEPRLPDPRARRHPRGAALGARRPVREGSWLALNFD